MLKSKVKKNKRNLMLLYLSLLNVLNIPECTYISGILNMPRVLNMPNFWIWQSSENASVLNMLALHSALYMPEYTLIDRVLNISWVLNMLEFWIWSGSKYARVTQGSKYATIWLNMSNRTWICLNMSEFR